MYTQQTVINDALNLLRGKLVRFILEDGDMRMIANLVQAADELGLVYDPEGMVYRMPELAKELEAEKVRLERNRKAREKYHANKNKPKRGRPRKEAA